MSKLKAVREALCEAVARAPSRIVLVELQDYFQSPYLRSLIGERKWLRLESRLDRSVDSTLGALSRARAHATFFVPGWTAERYPEIVRRIGLQGHEIASAGYGAAGLSELSEEELRAGLRRAATALSEAGVPAPLGYRNPHSTGVLCDRGHLKLLASEGYRYSATSFVPSPATAWPDVGVETLTPGGPIQELSPSALLRGRRLVPVGELAELSALPASFLRGALRAWERRAGGGFVLLFRTWELDAEQPRIATLRGGRARRQYALLAARRAILDEVLDVGGFRSVEECLGESGRAVPRPTTARKPDPRPAGAGVILPWTRDHEKAEVTVVVPCFNESESLPQLKAAIEELRVKTAGRRPFRFILVDDASTDDTHARLEAIFGDTPGYRVMRHAQNRGVAAAIQTGFDAAETALVASMDADCTYDPLELPLMADLLEREGAEMVTASPYHREGRVVGVPPWRLFLSKTLSSIYHLFLRNKLATYTACFRVARREAVQNAGLAHGDYLGIVEQVLRLDAVGGRICEFPTTLETRLFGESKMKTLRTIRGHLGLLVQILLSGKKGRPDGGGELRGCEETAEATAEHSDRHDMQEAHR